MRFWLGPTFAILFDRPEEIEAILTSKCATDKGNIYHQVTKCMGGVGLFSSQGVSFSFF